MEAVHKESKISLISYNCEHADDVRLPMLQELFDKCDFLLIQEHGLFKSQFDFFDKLSDNGVGRHGTSAMDEREIIRGRPYGGVAIVWHSNLQCKVTPIQNDSKRFCALHVNINSKTLLLICIYMPCDDRCRDQNARELVIF